ncbi:uncharacterized protein LOC134247347 [Saccostrea cucullata]|uniref:uncharacterized protein LOC134247347 n=1 Tax=Saccostrea cuccullata TaxID=36930 RepID=UPI002ED09D2D
MAAPIDSMSVNKTKSSELLSLENRDNVLSQVRDFLPQMEMANKALQEKSSEEIDIEQVSENQDRYIEMNIAMVEQNGDISEDSDSEHCSDSDCDIDSDSDECLMGAVTENNLRINKKIKHKPDIEELPNTASDKSGTSEHQDEHTSCVDNG